MRSKQGPVPAGSQNGVFSTKPLEAIALLGNTLFWNAHCSERWEDRAKEDISMLSLSFFHN
jgi:hypothetical protein